MHPESKGRRRSLMVLLLVLAAVALFGILVQQAMALPTFNAAEKGIGPCDKCHSMAQVHGVSSHSSVACATCHVQSGGTAQPPLPSACASCHGASNILAAAPHTAQGCASTPGCHGVPVTEPTATSVTLKVAPALIKFRKTVKASGSVTPAAELAGKQVVLKAEIKVASAWKSAKIAKATVSATGTYTWTYKPAKKGTYRMTATIVATSDYKGSKSPTRAFKVK